MVAPTEGKDEDPVDPDEEEDPEGPRARAPKRGMMEVKCPYTKPNGGVQKFGGWNNKGRKRFNDLVALIEANRRDRKKYLLEVETEALEQIRAYHSCDEREAKRKKKKTKVDEEDKKLIVEFPLGCRSFRLLI